MCIRDSSKSLWLIFLATCMGLIRLFSRQIVFGIGRKVEVNLRQKLFDHLLIQDPEWIQKKGSGDIISRATSDVENIRRLLGFTVLSLCKIVLAYSFTIPSMFSINKTLTISALMLFPLILGIVSLFGGRMVKQRAFLCLTILPPNRLTIPRINGNIIKADIVNVLLIENIEGIVNE